MAAVVADLDALAAGADETTAEIFEAMKMWLEDEGLLEIAEEHLQEGSDAAGAVGQAFNAFAEMFAGDEAFEERIADLQDLSRRVQANLAGIKLSLDLPNSGQIVLVGEDFSPADTAQFTAAVVGVRAGPRVAGGEETGRPVLRLQRPRKTSLRLQRRHSRSQTRRIPRNPRP